MQLRKNIITTRSKEAIEAYEVQLKHEIGL